MDAIVHLSEGLKQTINTAQIIAKEFQQNTFSGAHLLKVILSTDSELVELLNRMDKDVNYLKDWAEVRIESLPKSSVMSEDPPGDERIEILLEEADLLRIKFSRHETDAICLFAALCKPNIAFSPDQLKSFIVTNEEFADFVVGETATADTITSLTSGKSEGKTKPIKSLHKFCIDKTSLSREGKTDPIIGRDAESRIIIEILGRRTKPNVLIIGEPGVGKTALVDGLCNDIIAEKVPENLMNAIIFELDLGALAA